MHLTYVFLNPVSARCLQGRACQGRGSITRPNFALPSTLTLFFRGAGEQHTTRPDFALPRASESTSTLFFQGAGEQQQSTRRSQEERSREDGTGYAAVPPQTTGGQRRADGCSPQTVLNPDSARFLRGRACQGRGRTTRPVFALLGTSGSTTKKEQRRRRSSSQGSPFRVRAESCSTSSAVYIFLPGPHTMHALAL